MAEDNASETSPVVILNRAHLQTVRAENQRAGGQNESWAALWYFEMDLGVGAWKKLAAGIVNVHFHQEGT
jgi:hypothetical protein